MKIIEITYDASLGEASAIYFKEFLMMDRVVQLDCLVDAKAEIDSIYKSMLTEKV